MKSTCIHLLNLKSFQIQQKHNLKLYFQTGKELPKNFDFPSDFPSLTFHFPSYMPDVS